MAMKAGGCLLVDEISLADDAVLERLNSILEPERKLVISERSRSSGKDVFQISATDGFQFLATMNPGGDYGKKEVRARVLTCHHIYSGGNGGGNHNEPWRVLQQEGGKSLEVMGWTLEGTMARRR